VKKQPEAPDAAAFAHQLAAGLADIREALGPLDEAVRGYRDQLERDGWTTSAAEQMALAFYSLQISMLRQHITNAITTGGAGA